MVLIAQIWIKDHPKMFLYLCWFNWFIIKVYNWVQWGSFLPTKYNFLSLFIRVWIKVHFPFKSQVTYFLEVFIKIIRWSIDIISLTTENREVSSANSLHSLLRPSDKSLIYLNNKNPTTDLWGTPALTSAQDEHWTFKTTLCFRLRRKSCKMFISPVIPFWHSLKTRPLCHTLSKAFEISRNIPLTSSPLSNAFKISWLIERRSWLMQESPDLNPHWFGERRSLSNHT